MKKSKNKVILILAIILIMLVVIGLVADARYQTMLSGTGSASIANWSFKLVDADPQTTDIIELAVTRTDGSDKVAEGKLAPGTYGEFEIGIDARGTETALEYTIEISLENAPRNLIFYTDETRTEVLEIENSKVTQIGEMTLEEVNEIRTEKIYWEWPYETGETDSDIITNDEEDTQDSGKDVTMQITVTGVQMLEKVLLNTAWEMSYSGQVEQFVVPVAGTYQLEVYGAQGGTGGAKEGGKGGYASGNVRLAKGTNLYVCVGGKGESYGSENGPLAGGYNGGGNAYWFTNTSGLSGRGAAGGGATHIGTFNSILADHGTTEGLFIVAGGGGGSGSVYGWDTNGKSVYQSYSAGTGGGETGENGAAYSTVYGIATGGTQTEGGDPGKYGNIGTFGQGGNSYGDGVGAGGGGGLYGGAGSYYASGAGGGSGYIGGCIEGTTQMTNGVQSGDGYAKITLISY